MAKQTINLGTPNKKDGDLIRDAFNKVNQNFTEVYAEIPKDLSDLTNNNNLYATTAYVNTAVNSLVSDAPNALNTLNELAAALSNDANFAGTIITALAAKADISDLDGYATEQYVNNAIDDIVFPDISNFITAQDIPTIPTDVSDLTDTQGLIVNTGDFTFNGNILSTNVGMALRMNLGNLDIAVGNKTYSFVNNNEYSINYLEIPGFIQGGLQTSFVSSNGLGIRIDGYNSPNTVDIGNLSSSTVLRLKDGIGAGNIVVESLGTSLKLQTNNNSTWEFSDNGKITLPVGGDIINANGNSVLETGTLISPNSRLSTTLSNLGTLQTVPLLPTTFTATVDSDHYVEQTPGVGLVLTDDAWYFEVEFVVAANGTVETQITNNTPWPNNPGYQSGMQFAFTEADHGIPGYTFTLTLTDIQNPGMFMYTTNLAASVPPTLPPFFTTSTAFKLKANNSVFTFGTDGSITLPGNSIIDSGDNNIEIRTTNNFNVEAQNVVNIITDSQGTAYQWQFGDDGDLILPGKITATIDQNIQLESKSNITTPGQEITAADNQGLGSSDFITVWIEGSGGTDYPEIVAVQPGWTVSGPGLTNDIVTNVETIVYAPGMSVYRITTTTTSDKDGYSYIFTEPATLSVETNTWTFGTNGDLSMPNGLTVYGGSPILAVATGNNLGIATSRIQFQSAVAVTGSGPMTFVADISENDDITVVEAGWTVDVGGTTYTVTSVDDTTPGLFIIAVLNATFQVGQSYTFDNPVPVSSTWVFGNDGVLTTPAAGSISHLNNDLKLEVTGTDVIVLRTGGGDLVVTSGGDLQFNDGTTQTTAYTGPQTTLEYVRSPLSNIPGTINYSTVTANESGVTLDIKSSDGTGGNYDGSQSSWTFDVFGQLSLPASNGYISLPDAGSLGRYQESIGASTDVLVYAENKFRIQTDTQSGPMWVFGDDGDLRFPDSTIQHTAFTGNATTIDISNTNGLTTTYYPTFVESRNDAESLRADVDFTYRTDTNTLTVNNVSATGNITATGSITAASFTGNINITGDVIGTSPDVELVAGNYTWLFDHEEGTATFPNDIVSNVGQISGNTLSATKSETNKGGEIFLTLPSSGSSLSGNIVIDSYKDVLRFFESGNSNRGLYIDIANSPSNMVAIGYRDIPQLSLTTNTTLALSDAGKHYYSNNTTATITIPSNSSVAFSIGTAISLVQQGVNSITISPAAGVTLYMAGNSTAGSRTLSNYGMATLMKVATDTWFINGTGVS